MRFGESPAGLCVTNIMWHLYGLLKYQPDLAPGQVDPDMPGMRDGVVLMVVTEGWLEIDKHYSLKLCFSIEKQPE